MTAPLSRLLQAVAIRSLPAHRRGWGMAMAAEFDAAVADRRPLGFALGCLFMAWRMLPAHAEGRGAFARHALALGLLLPAAVLVTGVLGGVSGFHAAEIVIHVPATQAPAGVPVTAANRAAVPGLMILLLALAAGHLRLAWLVVERDWARAVTTGTFNASAALTLVACAGVLFLGDPRVLAQAGVVLLELAAIHRLARWQEPADWPAAELRSP